MSNKNTKKMWVHYLNYQKLTLKYAESLDYFQLLP